MTPEELDKLANEPVSSAPSPAAPPSPPRNEPAPSSTFGQMKELLETMKQIDQMKLAFLQTEMAQRDALEERITRQIEERFASKMAQEVAPPMDPIVMEGAKFLMDLLKQNMMIPAVRVERPVQKPPLNTTSQNAPQATTAPEAPPSVPPVENAQPAQQQEVEPMPEFNAEAIADGIYESFPDQVYALQSGKMTSEEAMKRIKLGGMKYHLTPEQCQQIYDALMATEYPNSPKPEVANDSPVSQ